MWCVHDLKTPTRGLVPLGLPPWGGGGGGVFFFFFFFFSVGVFFLKPFIDSIT